MRSRTYHQPDCPVDCEPFHHRPMSLDAVDMPRAVCHRHATWAPWCGHERAASPCGQCHAAACPALALVRARPSDSPGVIAVCVVVRTLGVGRGLSCELPKPPKLQMTATRALTATRTNHWPPPSARRDLTQAQCIHFSEHRGLCCKPNGRPSPSVQADCSQTHGCKSSCMKVCA